MSAAHIQLTIDLELRSEPITGSVGAGDAAPCAFRGWTELAALIEGHRASVGTARQISLDGGAPELSARYRTDH